MSDYPETLPKLLMINLKKGLLQIATIPFIIKYATFLITLITEEHPVVPDLPEQA